MVWRVAVAAIRSRATWYYDAVGWLDALTRPNTTLTHVSGPTIITPARQAPRDGCSSGQRPAEEPCQRCTLCCNIDQECVMTGARIKFERCDWSSQPCQAIGDDA